MTRLANYSTTVTALKSIGEIQGILVAHGAKHILMDYDSGEPIGLSFIVETPYGDTPFRLPANIDRVQAVLNKQRVRTTVHRGLASRVAWRILKDWVRAQTAILETEMVSIDQIFLPYMQVGDKGKGKYPLASPIISLLQLPTYIHYTLYAIGRRNCERPNIGYRSRCLDYYDTRMVREAQND